ncbi:hypothetical protein ACFLY3_05040 [Chloroflexota bacterium]
MKITLGCKKWSRGKQCGFRLYDSDIKMLGTILVYPSANKYWNSFSEFGGKVLAGKLPSAYSRYVTISDGENNINATATFAQDGNSFQGYITASHGTWLFDYVTDRMGDDLKCEYLVRIDGDFVLIPHVDNSVYVELAKEEKTGKDKVKKLLKKSHGQVPRPNLVKIGLYFELLEYDSLKSEFPQSTHKVLHRYPSIISEIQLLKSNNISCDIDVVTKNDNVMKCVEVKSVSLDEEIPFNLTLREWESRVWCRKHNIPYEIVVYHHFRYQKIRRVVIQVDDKLKRWPSGYYCLLTNP